MEHYFSISPRIIAHFGEDLIKNESIAILELVKNSYDACASECCVDFFSENEILKTISITDNGCGMNVDTIKNVWLVIGTDNKRPSTPNICGRYPLGEKGIGRLGVHKLGAKISLFSKTKKDKEVELTIDWSNLDKAKQINEFGVDVVEHDLPEKIISQNTGTQIIINELKSKWDKRLLRDVYRNLLSLNSPFGNTNDSFKVIINSNEPIFDGLPNIDEIKSSGLYFGSCTMKGKRIVDFSYEFKPWSSLDKISGRICDLSQLSEQDRLLKGLKNGEKKNAEYEIDLEQLQIGTIKFDVIIFETDSSIFNLVNAEKSSIRNYLRENGGVRVYRDNVRVYDYGEPDNDWLGIDLRRVHRVGGNVSNNIILGSVRLNRNESFGLREKTNREGFIEDNSYTSFVDAINYVLDIFVRHRNEDKTRLTTLYKIHKTAEPILSDLDEVVEIVRKRVSNEEDKNEILGYLFRINKQYRSVKEVLIKSANAGLNLSVVIHEIEKQIAALMGYAEKGEKEQIIVISKQLEQIVRGYTAMIRKSSIEKQSISNIVGIAIENYQFRFSDHKIKLHSNYKEVTLDAYFAEAEAISVLVNLLDNSIFWLGYSRKEKPSISIWITEEIQGYVSLIISDNGPGFNIGTDVAVEPFISGKPYGLGMGLGLHIANEMMKAMKGKLLFLSENDIKLPQYIKENRIDKAIIALCFPKEK